MTIEKRGLATREITLGHYRECVSDSSCQEMTDEMAVLFGSGRYDYPASILRVEKFEDYLREHGTTRRRAERARRRAYRVHPLDRSRYEADIYAINTSMAERQGRPMSEGYTTWQRFSALPEYPCLRHRIETWGVFKAGHLWAYLVLYLSGELGMVSQILGHGDKLDDEIMYLLFADMLGAVPMPVTMFYNRHDSGTDGLRFFKERLGFRPERVAWKV